MGLFDNVKFGNSEFVPNFVGSANNEIVESAKVFQDRFDKNVSDLDQLELLALEDQVLQADQGIKDDVINNLRGEIDSIASSNTGFENAGRQIAALAKGFVGNEQRRAALSNFQAVQDANAQIAELGPNALDFNPSEGFSTLDKDGNIRLFNPQVEARLQYDKRKEGLFDKLTADVREGRITQSEVDGILKVGTYRGISDSKVKNYVDDAFARYTSTAEFDQELRKLTELEGHSEEDATEIIKDSLLSVGRERVGGGVTTSRISDPSFVSPLQRARNAEVTGKRYVSTSNIPITQNPNVFKLPNAVVNARFDKDGNTKPVTEGRNVLANGKVTIYKDKDGKEVREAQATNPKQGGLKPGFTSETIDVNELENNLAAELDSLKQVNVSHMQDIANRSQNPSVNAALGKIFEATNSLSPKDLSEAYKNAHDKLNFVSVIQNNLSTDMSKLKTAQIFGESGTSRLDDKAVAVIGEGGTLTAGGNFATAMESLGYRKSGLFGGESFNTDALKNAEIVGVIGANPFGEQFQGAYIASVQDADGRPRKLIIQGDNEDQAAYALTSKLGQALYSNQPVTQTDRNGVQYKATPILDPTAPGANGKKGQWRLIVEFSDPNTGKSGITSLEHLRNMELDALRDSNVLGKDIGATKSSSVE